MSDGSFSGDGVDAPYFFLSYCHIEPVRAQEDPDHYVLEFFQDLCGHIMQLTDQPGGVHAGFMDRQMRPGARWNADIKRALATCRVFIPLYQPKYFRSEFCGMEWDAFSRREELHKAKRYSPHSAIMPVLWTPVDFERIPKVAAELQASHTALGEDYKREGLYSLAVRKNFHNGYISATLELATAIVDIARSTRLQPCDVAEFSNLRNVFNE